MATLVSNLTLAAPRRALDESSQPEAGGAVLAVDGDVTGPGASAVARALALRRGRGVEVCRIARGMAPAAAAFAIDAAAREARADIVVVGVGPPGTSAEDGRATARVLLRLVDVPLLVLAPGRRSLPRRALVLAGHGASAARVAHVAIGSLDRPGGIVLAHVRAALAHHGGEIPPGRRFHDARDAAMQLRRVESGLALPRGMRFDRTIRAGDPVESALELAREWHVDVIAQAVPGVSVHERALLGSHAARLIDDGRVSLLAVPTAPTA